MGFVLMYDITSEDSFNAVQDWYEILLLLGLFVFLGNSPHNCLLRTLDIPPSILLCIIVFFVLHVNSGINCFLNTL